MPALKQGTRKLRSSSTTSTASIPLLIDPVIQVARLTPNYDDVDLTANSTIQSVSISGDTIVVGAREEGEVYIFSRPSGDWGSVENVANMEMGSEFSNVVIVGDTLVVGTETGISIFTKPHKRAGTWAHMVPLLQTSPCPATPGSPLMARHW